MLSVITGGSPVWLDPAPTLPPRPFLSRKSSCRCATNDPAETNYLTADHRNPLSQARMIAQGVTVVALIASAGLNLIPNAEGKSDEDYKREEREAGMYAWKKNSPHAQHARQEAAASAEKA